jgi:hypothetical protein
MWRCVAQYKFTDVGYERTSRLHLLPWRRKQNVRLKCRYISTEVHGITSQEDSLSSLLSWTLTVQISVYLEYKCSSAQSEGQLYWQENKLGPFKGTSRFATRIIFELAAAVSLLRIPPYSDRQTKALAHTHTTQARAHAQTHARADARTQTQAQAHTQSGILNLRCTNQNI